ncbi:MAG: hypothetical protein JW708_00815 [Vallitaleaceae bacterium]|nr:hypothetical protein [Vallitaleaceae bacterium]
MVGDGKEVLLAKAYQIMPEYIKPSIPLMVSDEQFTLLLGYDPSLTTSGKEYTKDSTLHDIKNTFIGKVVIIFIKVALRKRLKTMNNPTMKLMVERTVFEMPLRAMKMGGGLGNHILDGLVAFANGHFFRGIRSLVKGKEKL